MFRPKVMWSVRLLLLVLSVAALGAADERSCTRSCNSRKMQVLKVEMCRDAKKILPRPKVGDYCTTASEQGFSDACMDLCMGKIPVSRLAQTCRAASQEMPRPTVRRWCEHGYQVAFSTTKKVMATEFTVATTIDGASEPTADAAAGGTDAAAADAADTATAADAAAAAAAAEPTRKLVATIPITLDDAVVDLEMFEGDSAEDSVVVFCRAHLGDDIAGCIRELLPTVLDRLADIDSKVNAAEPTGDAAPAEESN